MLQNQHVRPGLRSSGSMLFVTRTPLSTFKHCPPPLYGTLFLNILEIYMTFLTSKTLRILGLTWTGTFECYTEKVKPSKCHVITIIIIRTPIWIPPWPNRDWCDTHTHPHTQPSSEVRITYWTCMYSPGIVSTVFGTKSYSTPGYTWTMFPRFPRTFKLRMVAACGTEAGRFRTAKVWDLHNNKRQELRGYSMLKVCFIQRSRR